MNRTYLIFILVFVVVIGVFLYVKNNNKITNYPSSGTNIIAFGDSLVYGQGSNTGGGFVSILSELIDKPIINLGKNGDTTEDGLLRVEEVLGHDPKIVMVLFGGNDFLKKVPEEKTFSNLSEIIEKIQEKGAIVVLLGVQGGAIFDRYDEDYKALSNKYNTAYVENVLDGVIGRPSLMYDAVHPNDRGYRIIAYRVQYALEGLLE